MIRGRKLRARSARYPRRWPAVGGWSVAALAMGAVPVWLAYLHGRKPAEGQTADPVFETLGQSVPATALSCVALIGLVYCVRRLLQEAMAYRPGRIEVPVFAAGPGVTADAAQLTMAFRRRLADLSLSAPTPVPGAGSDGDFLEVLGREKLDAGNVPGTIVSLLRAAKPAHAWQVNGLLVRGESAPSCGVTLQVAQQPRGGNPPQTVWGASFEEAVLRAADYATAAILPRTRVCREPWAAWKHYLLPGELLSALEEGVRLESKRRYDEALDAYYRASACDPVNMALRLKIGQLQEKLGLYLDALMTYEGMLEVRRNTPPWRPFSYRYAARSQRRRALLAAEYRRIVLLGGSELAEQWRRTGPPNRSLWSARDARRLELRERLRRRLGDQLADVDRRHRGERAQVRADPGRARRLKRLRRCGRTAPTKLLEESSLRYRATGAEQERERCDRFEFRELLALLALKELGELKGRHLRFRDRRLQLTPAAVRLTQMCIEVRLAWIQAQLEPRPTSGEEVCWPPRATRVQDRIERLEDRRRFGRRRRFRRQRKFGRWHEHYNAACAYALPLMADLFSPGRPAAPVSGAAPAARASRAAAREEAARRDALAHLAVERLRRATSCADSGYIAGRREWLVSEDPDLDGLRTHPCFREFEAMYFPSDRPTPARPRHVRQLESARYIRELLADTADRWEKEWHRRGRELGKRPDVHTMLDWWRTELRAWELVRQVAVDHRHWLARLQLIEAMRGWAGRYGFAPLDVSFRRYEEQPLCRPDGALLCADSTDPTRLAERRLTAVHRCLPDRNARRRARVLLRTLEQWQSTLRQLDIEGRAPDKLLLAKLCDRHAALWQLLQQWLNEDAPSRQQACQTAFVAEITRHDEMIAMRAAALASNGRPQQRGTKRGRGATPTGGRELSGQRGRR